MARKTENSIELLTCYLGFEPHRAFSRSAYLSVKISIPKMLIGRSAAQARRSADRCRSLLEVFNRTTEERAGGQPQTIFPPRGENEFSSSTVRSRSLRLLRRRLLRSGGAAARTTSAISPLPHAFPSSLTHHPNRSWKKAPTKPASWPRDSSGSRPCRGCQQAT